MAVDGELLRMPELLNADILAEVDTWWRNLPPIYRARGRWVFVEPSELPQPRQRARRQIPLTESAPNFTSKPGVVDKHNKSSMFIPLEGESLAAWKQQCYMTTNQAFVKVTVPHTKKADEVWLRLMSKSHTSLLKPDAIETLRRWQMHGCSQRQREACSELLWSLQDHMTNKRGRTETKIKYGPKALPTKGLGVMNDPFFSSLGRPSSAPIAHPVHRKFERQKKAQEEQMLAMVQEKRSSGRAATAGAQRGLNRNLKSTIPMVWPGANVSRTMETSTQSMQRTVPISAFAHTVAKSESACPPASVISRAIGQPAWHGDAMYPKYGGQASAAFTPLNKMCYTHAHDRLKRFVL